MKWISVKDRVPENSNYYWVFAPEYSNSRQHSAFWNNPNKTWMIEGVHDYATEFVTHWMPLPPKP